MRYLGALLALAALALPASPARAEAKQKPEGSAAGKFFSLEGMLGRKLDALDLAVCDAPRGFTEVREVKANGKTIALHQCIGFPGPFEARLGRTGTKAGFVSSSAQLQIYVEDGRIVLAVAASLVGTGKQAHDAFAAQVAWLKGRGCKTFEEQPNAAGATDCKQGPAFAVANLTEAPAPDALEGKTYTLIYQSGRDKATVARIGSLFAAAK